jgi:hypothetical protein
MEIGDRYEAEMAKAREALRRKGSATDPEERLALAYEAAQAYLRASDEARHASTIWAARIREAAMESYRVMDDLVRGLTTT